MTPRGSILVAGAGPAGLTLALQAHAHGAGVRVIDRRPTAFRPSRALILHPRTLELLRPLRVTQALLDRADTSPGADLHLGRRVIPVRLGGLALADTAFPHLSLMRQADVEEVLAQELADRGVAVERGTELVSAAARPDGVVATLRAGGRDSQSRFAFLAGCDGPASTVRSLAGIGWPGGSYPVEVVLADVDLRGGLDGDRSHVAAGREGLVFVFRLGEQAAWRLLLTRTAAPEPGRPSFGQPGPPVPRSELQAALDRAGLRAAITNVAWSARIPVQHRVADRFRNGRLFLVGDAAHAYSPATGQGLNAAIQDAANLGWKLAFAVTAQRDDARLLDSYDLERRPVARDVLRLTHVAFWGEAGTGRVPSLLRAGLLPIAAPLIPLLTRRASLIASAIRVVSQLRVGYRSSPLSVSCGDDRPGGPRAGDRLPDAVVECAGRTVRLHELTARPGIHVLLDRDADALPAVSAGPLFHVHRLGSIPGRGLTVVRPDGHIGLRCQAVDPGRLAAWLDLIRAPAAAASTGPG